MLTQDTTVLILDHDPGFAYTLKEVLEARGISVREAHTGREALEIVRCEAIAVSVIDHRLEDIPGLEVLRRIRKASPGTECILLADVASQDLVIEATNAGGFGFLQKPCDLDQLFLLIRRAVERRDALEALRESEQHTRAILHSSLDAVVTIDELGTVIDWNPRAEETLGWSRREALGRKLFSLIFASEEEAQKNAWGAPGEVGLLNHPVETRIRHKDGHELLVEWAVTTVDVPSRRTFSFFIKDVTTRKRLEEQFLKAQKTETVSLLAGGVLHDFNNVLTAIMGQSAILKQDSTLSSDQRRSTQEILDAAHRASQLARQLLTYSQPQIRRPEILDLNAVIADLSRLLRRVLGESIAYERRLEPDLPLIEIDRSECEQVIMNLILNARDALPEGGAIEIVTEDVRGEDHRVALEICDNGTGMGKTTLLRAFEPFFTTKQLGQGVGLGLSTVKSIVEEADGRVSLESELGRGTVCRVVLPVKEARSPTAVSVGVPKKAGSGTETVLVVEDEAMVRATVRRILGRYGYQLLEAADGPEAVRVVEEHDGEIELLVTDVVMPKMSGKEVALKLTELRPRMRVLYISGYTGDVNLRRGMMGAGVELLAKPFSAQELLAKVREVLDRPRGEG